MEHLDHPSPHFNDVKMARLLLLRTFIIALGGMGDNCSILYCLKIVVLASLYSAMKTEVIHTIRKGKSILLFSSFFALFRTIDLFLYKVL